MTATAPRLGRGTVTGSTVLRQLTVERLCAWCGPLLMVVFAVGYVGLIGWLPPPSPSTSPVQITAMYEQHRPMILMGCFLLQVSMGMILPFGVSIAVQCRRIERDRIPTATYVQLSSIAVAVVVVVLTAVFWAAAAFRAGTVSPEITSSDHDLGWFLFLYPWVPFTIWMIAIAVPILQQDDSDEPVYPRWVGFLSLWSAFLFAPAGMISLFTSGPFSWNGVIAFYLPVGVFFTWLVAMSVTTLRAIGLAERVASDCPAPG
ncbi:hypothetical protein [Actinomycetospora sp. TBRC 11914]|uniref:hypothetical protein n=1 Tax=Actinomycetospora sp. TBRC 11914 TaxID=2729387 RepID=UPI00145D1113|nr:hypothetical protein [Actinomycetospora sp. TBRC 11914]NMO91673.1 hypothetical protein [Actinomycetospora sp. TBRC 11914]